jgi:hypothetical protein
MRHAVQFEAIKDLLAPLVAGDDAGFAQDVQVLGGRGPAEPNCVHEVADTPFAVHEGADERQASGVSECFEDLVGRCAKRPASHDAKYFAKWRNFNQELPQFVSAG